MFCLSDGITRCAPSHSCLRRFGTSETPPWKVLPGPSPRLRVPAVTGRSGSNASHVCHPTAGWLLLVSSHPQPSFSVHSLAPEQRARLHSATEVAWGHGGVFTAVWPPGVSGIVPVRRHTLPLVCRHFRRVCVEQSAAVWPGVSFPCSEIVQVPLCRTPDLVLRDLGVLKVGTRGAFNPEVGNAANVHQFHSRLSIRGLAPPADPSCTRSTVCCGQGH